MKNINVIVLLVATFLSCTSPETTLPTNQTNASDIQIIGEMRQVMREGKLDGVIRLDTLSDREHLYGLGPIAYLKGEIMIIDGVSYRSMVQPDSSMVVDTSFAIDAPFFGYANIERWTETNLPDSVHTLSELERYLDETTKDRARPFFFRLVGSVADATIHVVNLPDGTSVSSPDDAHVGQVDYQITDTPSELLGFFSTEHKAIFTHHDTYLHMHLITADRAMMGHVDALMLGDGVKLFVED